VICCGDEPGGRDAIQVLPKDGISEELGDPADGNAPKFESEIKNGQSGSNARQSRRR